MEKLKVKYVFPNDYKSSMKILYLKSYSNYNFTICLSFCLLWIGSFFIIFNIVVYGLLLVLISLLSFINVYRNLKIATNKFIKRHQFYPEYSSGKTAVFSDKIYINDSANDEIKEYRYSDIECIMENEELFFIKLKFNAYIPIYKTNFITGKPSELRDFLYRKNNTLKYTYVKRPLSNNTILVAIALAILTFMFILVNS